MVSNHDLVLEHSARVQNIINEDSSATSAIVASWRRSMLRFGLRPDQGIPDTQLAQYELSIAREAMELLLFVAKPVLEQLFQTVGRSGCCVVLTDRNGVVLDRLSHAADDVSFDGWSLRAGSVWSEQERGTNGIGTCMIEERTVLIHKDQHFCSGNIGMTCMGAPIFDANGRLMAVLDVSSARDDFSAELARLITSQVAEAAYRVELEYFRASFNNAKIVIANGYSPIGTPLLASNKDDFIIGANRAARRMFSLDENTFESPIFINELFPEHTRKLGLEDAEKTEVLRAIAKFKGNMSAAAKDLNVSRTTFYRMLKKHKINRE